MSTRSHTNEDQTPTVTALVNAGYAMFVCTLIHILCGWGIDWVNSLVGNPPAHKAPTWTGTVIVASQTGWPVLVVATLCGLFGRDLNGLTPTLIATHFLAVIDPSASLIVGVVLVVLQGTNDE